MQPSPSDRHSARSATELWLAHLVDLLGAQAGLLTVCQPGGSITVEATGLPEPALKAYRDHFHALDPVQALLVARADARSLVLHTRRHPAYRGCAPFLNGFLRRHELAHIAALAWQRPDHSRRVLQLFRTEGMPSFLASEGRNLEQLTHHWRVHDARPEPLRFMQRPIGERRRSDIAAQLPIPLAVVDGGVKVIWANPAAHQANDRAWAAIFEACPHHASSARTRVRPELCAMVRTCLAQHAVSEAIIQGTDSRLFATAAPLEGQPGLALLRMNTLNQDPPGIRSRLQQLLSLTPAEAELAVLLASGESIDSIAQLRQVSPRTVRSQLQTIFRKTETHRQGELVCLVRGLSQPR